ncbi:MAG: hypothetical protein IKC69_07680, partial [Clostridia bacterium]|nr:hypothetical protein [Clostridia bacterium]
MHVWIPVHKKGMQKKRRPPIPIKQKGFFGIKRPKNPVFDKNNKKTHFFATNKLRHSTYLCTPSGNQKARVTLLFAQFVRSASFFPIPLKGAVK